MRCQSETRRMPTRTKCICTIELRGHFDSRFEKAIVKRRSAVHNIIKTLKGLTENMSSSTPKPFFIKSIFVFLLCGPCNFDQFASFYKPVFFITLSHSVGNGVLCGQISQIVKLRLKMFESVPLLNINFKNSINMRNSEHS